MKYLVRYSSKIKRQLKIVKKRGYDMNLFKDVVAKLANGKPLPSTNHDHELQNSDKGRRHDRA